MIADINTVVRDGDGSTGCGTAVFDSKGGAEKNFEIGNSKKVAVGMSGGVDSSVAAAVLKEKGYDVTGVTMRLWDGEEINGSVAESTCCSMSATEDARFVCAKLGVDYHVLDFRKEFRDYVINYFINEYLNGRTPNPCIACNRHLKFDAMAKKVQLIGADYIATGHYAKVGYNPSTGRYLLKRADAGAKDQTYALYSLTQKQLSGLLLPLGDFKDKAEVRAYAEKMDLINAKKPDSQEICFVPDNDYVGFIKRHIEKLPPEGEFVDIRGNVIGRHKGIVNYTVGQRKGLGIAFGKPMFVIRIDAVKNQIVLGEQGCEFSDSLYAADVNFIPFETLTEPMHVFAKVRYSAKAAPAVASVDERGFLKIEFEAPQRAITPGQAVVLYKDDLVLGGGTII